MKTIALVANTTWNLYHFRLPLLKWCAENGYHVLAIAPPDDDEPIPSVSNVQYIPLYQLERKGMNPIQDLRLYAELLAIYQKWQPDLIIHYTIKPNIYGGLAAKTLNLNYFCVVTGLGYTFLKQGWLYYLSKQFYKQAFQKALTIFFENEDDKQLFETLKIVSSAQAIAVNGCGIDTQSFQYLPKTVEHQPFTFGFVGRYLKDKGFVEYVAASEQIQKVYPQIRCWTVGSTDVDNPATVLDAQIQEWEQAQIIENQGFAADIRAYLRNMDCLVLPSYREGMATILAEAAAMHKPIITTNVAGCRNMVESGKNGYLVAVQSVPELAQAMLKMYELSAAERTQMGLHSRRKAEHSCQAAPIVQVYTTCIEQVTGRSSVGVYALAMS